jgi:hypothetical protein
MAVWPGAARLLVEVGPAQTSICLAVGHVVLTHRGIREGSCLSPAVACGGKKRDEVHVGRSV